MNIPELVEELRKKGVSKCYLSSIIKNHKRSLCLHENILSPMYGREIDDIENETIGLYSYPSSYKDRGFHLAEYPICEDCGESFSYKDVETITKLIR